MTLKDFFEKSRHLSSLLSEEIAYAKNADTSALHQILPLKNKALHDYSLAVAWLESQVDVLRHESIATKQQIIEITKYISSLSEQSMMLLELLLKEKTRIRDMFLDVLRKEKTPRPTYGGNAKGAPISMDMRL